MPRTAAIRLKKLLLALAALAGLYLLAANLFLTTPVGPWAINRNPSKLRVTWSQAWSLYPGDLRVRRLAVEGHTGRVDWSLAVDRGRGWIDLPALVLKRFRVRGFSGEGVRSSTVRRVEIAGRPRGAAPRHPWRIEMRGVALTHVREIGYDRLLLAGDGTARGGFSLTIGGDFALTPTTLLMPGARLLLGTEAVARDLDVHAEMQIAPYAPRRHPGAEGFDFVTGTLRARGRTVPPQVLARAGDPAAAELALDLRLDHGRLGIGSRGSLRAEQMTALLAVEGSGAGPRLVFRADGQDLALGRRTDGPPFAAAEALHLEAATGEARFSRLFSQARELRHSGNLPVGALSAEFRAAGLRLASAGPRPAWQLAAESAGGWIDLPALLRREILLQRLRADGVSVRAERFRQSAPPANRRRWAVRLTDARLTGIREIEIADLRLDGAAEASGGFSLAPDGILDVHPAALQISGGRVRRGEATLVSNLSLRAEAALGPYSPTAQPGPGVLDAFSGTVTARGTLNDLPFLPLGGRRHRSGDFNLDLSIDRGNVSPGAQMTVTSGRSLLVAGAVTAEGSGPPRLHLAAEAKGFTLGGAPGRTGGTPPVLRAKRIVLRTSTRELRLRRLLATADEVKKGGSPKAAALTGDLEASGLQINGLGERIVWQLNADRGSGRLDLAALRRRLVVLSGVRIEEASAQVDPVRGAAPVVPPEKRWEIRIGDGRIDGLRSIAFGTDRLIGSGALEGALSFDRSRLLTVTRAVLTMPAGAFESGRAQVARGVALRADARITPFVPGMLRGAALLRLVSGTATVKGQVSSLGFLQRYLSKAPWLQIQGQGRLDADVRLDQGRLLPGSRVDVRGRVLAGFLDDVATGEATVTGTVEGGTGRPSSKLRVDFSSFEIAPQAGAAPAPSYVRGTGLRLAVASTDLDLATPVTDLRATVDLPDGQVPDLTVYNAYLPAGTGVAILSGSGRLRLHLALDADTQKGDGEVALSSDSTRVRFQDVELAGNVMLTARLASSDLKARRFQIAGTRLDLDRVTYRDVDGEPGTESAGWWAHIELIDGSMVWTRPLVLNSKARLEMKDSGFLLSVFARKKGLLRWFHKLLSIEGVTAEGTLRCGDGAIEIAPLRVTGGRFDLRSRLRFSRGSNRGDLFVRWGKLATGIELRDGKRTFKLRHPEEWFERGREPE